MTDSTVEYLPLEKTWYHYTDEGAAFFESAPLESESPESESSATEAPETAPTVSSDGCGSAVGGVPALACVVGAAALIQKRSRRKK
jgi:hypothetical protein